MRVSPFLRRFFAWAPLCFSLLLPALSGAAFLFGRVYVLRSVPLYLFLLAVLLLLALLAGRSSPSRVASFLLPPAVCVSCLLALLRAPSPAPSALSLLCAVLALARYFLTPFPSGRALRLLRGLLSAVYALLGLAFCALMLLCLFFSLMDFVHIDRASAVSLDGRHVATLIVSDEGALDGQTRVELAERASLPLLLGSVESRPVVVYTGEWRRFEDDSPVWLDERRFQVLGLSFSLDE